MRLYPEKLAGHLKQQLLPVYLISGDEPLLVQECCDLVRKAARDAGCTDREIIDVVPRFKWDEILHSASSMSLFAERKLVEIRMPSGKPGADGSKALCEYLDMAAGSDDILLIVSGKIDKQSTNSKWYKALDKAGATVQIWPIEARDLPRWLQQRCSAAGLSIDNDALQLLCEQVEGNLLAAVQEVEKLKLLASDGQINAETITASVSNNARYNLFDMTDHALKGNAGTSLKMLHGLRGEGTEPAVALWALLREVRTLHQARQQVDAGQSPQQVLGGLRVWKNRMPLMQGALSRHNSVTLTALLEQASAVDGTIKGFAAGKPWDQLENLVLQLAASR
ncbi:DNA polymerase III subunit delta [Halioglobus sp. HI00S01]|uniref:DNA polymerase III subunit delta n=1 Tax=Halioglobus sp. HI00S01 TaxID=1822214 RepID=UPI0007C30F02|nr:DNA polymerase III subunit delta [Halioglobus sp. HI00S01]KZX56921.1 DNA polymerase III subunit delta [Halioglobus sp. HI00S01]